MAATLTPVGLLAPTGAPDVYAQGVLLGYYDGWALTDSGAGSQAMAAPVVVARTYRLDARSAYALEARTLRPLDARRTYRR